MNTNTYVRVSGALFGIITVLHLLRLLYGWDAAIGGVVIPLWASGIAVFAAGCLAYTAFTLRKNA